MFYSHIKKSMAYSMLNAKMLLQSPASALEAFITSQVLHDNRNLKTFIHKSYGMPIPTHCS
jgi:hypothetical protein